MGRFLLISNNKDYTIEPCEDTTYYAIQTCNVRSGPSTDYDTVRQLAQNEAIVVNGRVKAANGKNWCVIKTDDGSTQMVSGSLISTEPVAAKKQSNTSSNNNTSKDTTNKGNTSKGSTVKPAPAPAPSDCASDCDWGDCAGDCDFSDCLSFADCDCYSCDSCYDSSITPE